MKKSGNVWRGEFLSESKNSRLPASFTIEAALLVPLVLAVLFLFLQIILFLHDTVTAEAWLYHETWKQRWNEEQEAKVFEPLEVPRMSTLRYEGDHDSGHGNAIRRECHFRVELFPAFITVLFHGQPDMTQKRSVEIKTDPWQFMRIAGAIAEEWEGNQ